MKQNITIRRYANAPTPVTSDGFSVDVCTAYEASVEPADGSWVLFVPKEGRPQLWIKAGEVDHGDGTGEDVYLPAELADDPGALEEARADLRAHHAANPGACDVRQL